MNGTEAANPLVYPWAPHQRRHGPTGYADPTSYKPWLRDEFSFRCVFCLVREQWFPSGHAAAAFGVEHLLPKSTHPELACHYANLCYSCSMCNARKGINLIPDPCQVGYGQHLRVGTDGVVHALTPEGAQLLKTFLLNEDDSLRFRQRVFTLIRIAAADPQGEVAMLVKEWLAFPEDLPDLAALRPPGGNTRPEGVTNCCFALRQRGELPESY